MTDKHIPNERRQYEYKSVFTNTDKQIIIDDLIKQLNEKTVVIMLLRETLDRKEQECEDLKEKYKWYDHYKEQALYNKNLCNEKSEQLDQLKAENEELKRQYKELGQCSKRLKDYYDKEKETLSNKFLKLKQNLIEIKEIAEKCRSSLYEYDQERYPKQILQKISEVEND